MRLNAETTRNADIISVEKRHKLRACCLEPDVTRRGHTRLRSKTDDSDAGIADGIHRFNGLIG